MIIKASVVQESPVFFAREETFEKVERIVAACAGRESQLIVFPESFIPGYPRGFDFGTRIGSRTPKGKRQYAEYHRASVDLSGRDRIRLESIAESNGVYLVIGITEKTTINGSLYCSMAYISPKKGLMGVHRKIKPTGTERLVWGEGNGKDLVSCRTDIGILGGLICWENYMPAARMAMYRKGVQLYIAPTADSRENWTATLIHIALEGRCFVLGCNQYFEKSMVPEQYRSELKAEPELMCRGGSVIIAPSGEILTGPLFDRPGILEATLDLDEIIASKLDMDVNGHYSRPDMFKFNCIDQPDTVIESEIE